METFLKLEERLSRLTYVSDEVPKLLGCKKLEEKYNSDIKLVCD